MAPTTSLNTPASPDVATRTPESCTVAPPDITPAPAAPDKGKAGPSKPSATAPSPLTPAPPAPPTTTTTPAAPRNATATLNDDTTAQVIPIAPAPPKITTTAPPNPSAKSPPAAAKPAPATNIRIVVPPAAPTPTPVAPTNIRNVVPRRPRQEPPVFIACRHGRGVSGCIFLTWDDSRQHLRNYPLAEFQVFKKCEDAVLYLQQARCSTVTLQEIQNQLAFNPTEAITNATTAPAPANTTAPATATKKKPPEESIQKRKDHPSSKPSPAKKPRKDAPNTEAKSPSNRGRSNRPFLKWLSRMEKARTLRQKDGSFRIDLDDLSMIGFLRAQLLEYKKYQAGTVPCYMSDEKVYHLREAGLVLPYTNMFALREEDLKRPKKEASKTPRNPRGEHNRPFKKWMERLEQVRELRQEDGTFLIDVLDLEMVTYLKRQLDGYQKYCKKQQDKATAKAAAAAGDASAEAPPAKRCFMSAEKVKHLKEVGLILPNGTFALTEMDLKRPTDNWLQGLVRYKEWHDKHTDNAAMPAEKRYVEKRYVEQWMVKQQEEYRDLCRGKPSSMIPDKIRRLKSAGFVFRYDALAAAIEIAQNDANALETCTFEEWVDVLQAYLNDHPDSKSWKDIDESEERCASLRTWWKTIEEQMSVLLEENENVDDEELLFSNTSMNYKRVHRLRKIQGGPFIELEWDIRISQLEAYKEEHGHMFVPQRHPIMGKWIMSLKAQVDKNRKDEKLINPLILPNGRMEQLKTMGMDLTNSNHENGQQYFDYMFQRYFPELQEYKRMYGDCQVKRRPNESLGLFNWLVMIKREYQKVEDGKRNRMSVHQLAQLNELGYVFHVRAKQDAARAAAAAAAAATEDNDDDYDDGW